LGGVEFLKALNQLGVVARIAIFAGDVMQIRSKLVPFLRVDGADFGHGLGGFAQEFAKALVIHRRSSEADNGVARPEQVVDRQVVHGRYYLALGQVAGGAEEHHSAGVSDDVAAGVAHSVRVHALVPFQLSFL
jgi:hypothetical protein